MDGDTTFKENKMDASVSFSVPVLRKLKKLNNPGCCTQLLALMTIDGELCWRKVACPVSSSPSGDICGEWCVWYGEDEGVITCKETPIGELVTE
jgi:hypothetical protein